MSCLLFSVGFAEVYCSILDKSSLGPSMSSLQQKHILLLSKALSSAANANPAVTHWWCVVRQRGCDEAVVYDVTPRCAHRQGEPAPINQATLPLYLTCFC